MCVWVCVRACAGAGACAGVRAHVCVGVRFRVRARAYSYAYLCLCVRAFWAQVTTETFRPEAPHAPVTERSVTPFLYVASYQRYLYPSLACLRMPLSWLRIVWGVSRRVCFACSLGILYWNFVWPAPGCSFDVLLQSYSMGRTGHNEMGDIA